MEPNPQLFDFIKPYDQHIQGLALDVRQFITELVPQANELIWDNYNAVAIAYSKSEKLKDAFCNIALYGKHINFGFNQGTSLSTVNVPLEGKGKHIRHLQVKNFETFPAEAITPMILEAVEICDRHNPALLEKKTQPKSLVMSISEKKVRPKG